MKSMTERAGGELCLPQRPHNQVGTARRRIHQTSCGLIYDITREASIDKEKGMDSPKNAA